MNTAYRTLEEYAAAIADASVVCPVCAGAHLPRFCQLLDDYTRVRLATELGGRAHGTLTQARAERLELGAAGMCPPCRAVWDANETRNHPAHHHTAEVAA